MPGTPYGYYTVKVSDARINPGNWIDVWFTATNGSIFRPNPSWDSTLLVWYNIVYVYDGYFTYRTLLDETAHPLVIFYAPATYEGAKYFDAAGYWARTGGKEKAK